MNQRRFLLTPSSLLLSLLILPSAAGILHSNTPDASLPRTVAEKSEYKATSRYADVVDFCERLKKLSPLVRLGEPGGTLVGRAV